MVISSYIRHRRSWLRILRHLEREAAGAELTVTLLGNPACLAAARQAIPAGYLVTGETAHPNFLTADFALVRDAVGELLVPRPVGIQHSHLYMDTSRFCALVTATSSSWARVWDYFSAVWKKGNLGRFWLEQ